SCANDALSGSLFCEEHQGNIAPVVKAPRFRRLDVVLVALVGLLLWTRPEVRTPVWHTVFRDDQPGIWETTRTFFARLMGSKSTNEPSDGASAAEHNDAPAPAAAESTDAQPSADRVSAPAAALALVHPSARGV